MSWVDDVLSDAEVWSRAPSAHNTQPWVLRAAEDRLVLDWDPSCELTVSDPTRRDLWLSLGAFTEAVAGTAADRGHTLEVHWEIDTRSHRAAVLRRAGSATPPLANDGTPGPPTALTPAPFTREELLARRTARGPYRKPFATHADVEAVADGARDATSGAPALALLPAGLGDSLLPRADAWSYSSPAQVRELRRWLRLDRRDPAYRQDGLTDEALVLSAAQARALRVILNPRVWAVVRHARGPRLMAAAGRPAGLGSVVAFHVPSEQAERPADVATAGRMLLRVWLAAARLRLSVHPLSQLIDAPATAGAIHAACGTDRRALSVFRLGHPEHPPVRSHRRPVAPPPGTPEQQARRL